MNRYLNLTLKVLIAAAILSSLVALTLLAVDYFKTKDAFPPKTFICRQDVSFLSREEAILKLRQAPPENLFPPTFVFQNTGESFAFPAQDLGIHVLPEETVDAAFSTTHKDSYIRELRKRLSRNYLVLSPRLAFNEVQARKIIAELAQKINSPPKDASVQLDETTGGYHIARDFPARQLLTEETLSACQKALFEGQAALPLLIDYAVLPRITEAELRAHPPVYRLSAFTTYYGKHDSPNRIHNIKLIASWLNNTILISDEVLSLAERIGDFSAERGFKEAFVILQGELVPQLGGGTCQIGTTLYNAVSLADLDIVSRRNHSFYFNIYPLGRDATVYPGQVDFKFKNNTGYPIMIKAVATDKKLSFRIYGTPTGKVVTFSYPSVLILDETGQFRPSSLREVIDTDRPFRTVVTRTVRDAQGKIIKEEAIRSYYKLYGEKNNVPIRRPEPR